MKEADQRNEVTFVARGHTQQVVGEASYQQALEVIGQGRTQSGTARQDVHAVLVRDPTNVHDSNAVRVEVEGHTVGFLPRDDAPRFHAVLEELRSSNRSAVCRALLIGGWDRGPDDRGHIGIVLILTPTLEIVPTAPGVRVGPPAPAALTARPVPASAPNVSGDGQKEPLGMVSNNSGGTPDESRALDQRIALSIDNWKRKLLDLTKRNRLLHFRTTKVSTIAVVDELPAEVFRRLYISERAMRFRAVPKDESDPVMEVGATLAAEAGESEGDDQEDVVVGGEFVPYEPGAAEDRHSDEWLQTARDPEALDKSLRRIDEQARLTIEEQGVNTLFLTLGMLEYVESVDSEEVFRAPLLLLPVQLTRKGARSAYDVRIGDDDPIINPALFEHMRRIGVTLPDFPESDAIGDDYDLQLWFVEVRNRISERARWSVRTDIYLGLFSFQKFVMFKDLEQNAVAVGKHRLTRQLVGREGNAVVGLPEEIRKLDLDEEFPAEKTFQVVDADSSQLRAIVATARGHDIVIEGPPGTGKSQTITNLIAQALSGGQTVLFVAEKMAALNVVHARLVAAGLSEFCLELHSSRANKRLVMKDLAATLDASLQSIATTASAHERLPAVRKTLSDYVEALHTSFGALGVAPFEGYGELCAARSAPAVSLSADIGGVTRDLLYRTIRELDDLTASSAPIGRPSEHPWRDSARTLLTESDLEDVGRSADAVVKAAETLRGLASEVEQTFGLPPIATRNDVDVAIELGTVLSRSPGASLAVLESEAWNTPPAGARRLIDEVRELVELRQRVAGRFVAAVLEREHRNDIEYLRAKASGAFGFLAILDARYRAIRTRWKQYRLSGYASSLLAQADDLEDVDRLIKRRDVLHAAAAEAGDLFGALWTGESSDVEALERYVAWVVEFRKICVSLRLEAQGYQLATKRSPDTSAFGRLRDAADAYTARLAELGNVVEWPAGYLSTDAVSSVQARARTLFESIDRGPQWAAFERCRKLVAGGLAAELLPSVVAGTIEPRSLSLAFRRAFWMRWLVLAVKDRPPLERFASLTHDQRVSEFRDLDKRVLRENRGALIEKLRSSTQDKLRGEAEKAALPFLQRQLVRQRNIGPLRRTMKTASAAIRAIKPCFMMSPMTVAQYLDGAAPSFDLVIFDEASQLPTEDAIGAVVRGRQLAVVGDPKQLPPTNFFAVEMGQSSTQRDEDGNPIIDDAESILEEFMGAGMPMSRLKWHYRSAHETLISFSNVTFYDADLYTFPSVDSGTRLHGLSFEHVRDGVYEGKGLNLAEARRVADEVVHFAREQIRLQQDGHPTRSLGVGTFNLRQQIAIQDEIERRRREDPSIETFFAREAAEPFFVKNLENIQGDERDVIFISVTYGRGIDGRIRYNFGPINGQNGWRRLNVLVTRARQQMRVFASMKGEDINPVASASGGPRLLKDFLTYAEHGRLDGVTATGADADSPFEQEVFAELAQRGIRVVPQVGASGYKIDIGVLDEEVQGRFLCGIECDGAAYHASETARDRDRLRQQVLEARGWTIHRVWSTDWFKDRKGQIERLLGLIAKERERAKAEDEAEVTARVRQIERESQTLAAVRLPELNAPAPTAPYRRPEALPYRSIAGEGRYAQQDLLSAPYPTVVQSIKEVVDIEGPAHEETVLARIAAMWGTRLGKNIRARIEQAAAVAAQSGFIRRRGDFYWAASDECVPRSRARVRMDAERIAPEEYRAAILAVLAGGHSFPRNELIAEVRAVLGMARTGADLATAIGSVIDAMLRDETLGEASAGIRLRRAPVVPKESAG